MDRKVLIISTMPTHPTDAGNRSAIMAQVEFLKKMGCQVHFLFASMELSSSVDYAAMESYWGERLHIFSMNIFLKIWRILVDVWRRKTSHCYWKVDDHYPWGLTGYVNRLHDKEKFDACIVQYYRLSRLLPHIQISRKALYAHDVFSYKDIRVGHTFYETLNALEEAKAMQRSPVIFAIQHDEAVYFRMLSPKSVVYTVYNPYKVHSPEIKNNRVLLFLASRMLFNVEGIQSFLDNIWPLLSAKINGIKLIVGGSVCESIHSRYSNVTFSGVVENLDEFYSLGDIVINPVFQGTGLKIKTFEALPYGKATVVHPHSKAGIYNQENAPLLEATTPDEWVDVIDGLVNNPDKVLNLSNKSIEYIRSMDEYIETQYRNFLY